MKRIIMHIDVNNAFLSWTAVLFLKQGFKYDIRNSYVVIAGDERKRAGVVLARSDACKKVGIITGEPLYKARKKCPALKTYPPNSKWYEEMSNQLFTFLKNYSPDLEIYSIDECFIDYTKIKSLYGDELLFAHKIKDEIYQKLGFTVNIGIGNNKLCAKMASDFKKPNLVHTLYEHEIETKMWSLPIEKLFGVGRKTSPKMRKLGINTIHDLAHYNQYKLSKYFKNQALKYIETANGIDNSEFFAGDMKDVLNADFISEHGHPDLVILDPPRAGIHPDVAKVLLGAAPSRIIYVSCNPASQARDLAIFSSIYQIVAVQPVDMFPHTHHVENVVSLMRNPINQ